MTKIKFPKDIRYANRIWMSMVLVSPLLPFLPYLIGGRMSFESFATSYAAFIFASGFLFILYWAAILPVVLTINSWKYTVTIKKWLIQFANLGLLALFLGYLFFKEGNQYSSSEFLILTLSYVLTSSFAIWFFDLESLSDLGDTQDDFEIIEHLVEK